MKDWLRNVGLRWRLAVAAVVVSAGLGACTQDMEPIPNQPDAGVINPVDAGANNDAPASHPDAAPDIDAGADAGPDAGPDAGTGDAGTPADALAG